MERQEIYARLKEVFADVFDREVELHDETTASDVEGWDSLRHIMLISAVEEEFEIKFDMKAVRELKNVGAMVDVISEMAAP
ncbi:MAG: acyl carrier protein [Lachnospiraceae bacterium]|nr:acyl carrier protein [Lachnospiraceae bacterium]